MDTNATFEQMRGAVGSLLLLWSEIERTARAEVDRVCGGAGTKASHMTSAVLNTWATEMSKDAKSRPFQATLAAAVRTRLQQSLDLRNGVCHGLLCISAGYEGNPATLFWDWNGKKQGMTWTELQAEFRWLSRVPSALSLLTDAAAEGNADKAARRLPDPDWWKSEYGIDVCLPLAPSATPSGLGQH